MSLADLARSLAEAPRALTVYGAPEGHDAATIGALVADTWLMFAATTLACSALPTRSPSSIPTCRC